MKNRSQESLAPLFEESNDLNTPLNLVLLAPSDVGVRRNLGRNGARFAPKALTNQLKKLNNHEITHSFKLSQVTDQELELKDFNLAQEQEAKNIHSEIDKYQINKLLHIGGGHDHVFPFLRGLEKSNKFSDIVILNIDAHCDTRVDDITHSGTPFRDFSNSTRLNFHLIQFGVQDFANSDSTLSKLKQGSVEYVFLDQLREESQNFSKVFDIFKNVPFKISEQTLIILSLDCDGLDGSTMQAVSAVNPNGIPAHYLIQIIKKLKEYKNLAFGIYEFNPVYESNGLLSTKVITSLIYEYLK